MEPDIARLAALRDAMDLERARRSLSAFLRAGWHVLEPTTRLDWAWHIEALCEHVQAMIEAQWRFQDTGEIPKAQNLAINVPPGTLKSRILSVYAPAWAWIHRPSWKLLALSSNPVVADRDADLSKQLVESTWYRESFGIQWAIRKERDAIRNFGNTHGGFRISRGLNATVTGLRGDAIFVDDPNDVKDVSDTKLEAVARNWRAAQNRVNDERTAIRILIQQRTHEKDLTGTIFESGSREAEGVDWQHLVIPMEREIEKPCVACKVVHAESFTGWTDPRTADGEVLHQERNTPRVIARMKRALGSYGYAGQGQQRPSPEGGGLFKVKYWRNYDTLETTRAGRLVFDKLVISIDANFKEGGTSRAAISVILGKGPGRYVLDAWAGSVDYPTLRRKVEYFAGKYPLYTKILIEDKANGSALIAELGKKLRAVVAINPLGGKVTRANAMLPDVEAGDWYLPRNAPWREDFVEEFAAFPTGRYDDYVDTLSQAAADMSSASALEKARALGSW